MNSDRTAALAASLLFVAAVVTGCGTAKPGGMSGPSMNSRMTQDEVGGNLQSDHILGRNQVTSSARVRHILIGWKDLAAAYRGRMDKRAKNRSKAQADDLARSLFERAGKGEPFEALLIDNSEDPGSAPTAALIEVAPYSKLVAPFIKLSLRLNVGEIGVVRTQFGWHIIKRIS